jgi:hypothetical protein
VGVDDLVSESSAGSEPGVLLVRSVDQCSYAVAEVLSRPVPIQVSVVGPIGTLDRVYDVLEMLFDLSERVGRRARKVSVR